MPPPPTMETDLARQRLDIARQLLGMFKAERIAYLVITTVVAVVLVGFGFSAALQSDFDLKVMGTFFGSAGLVAFTTSRVLKIWNQVFESVMGDDDEPDAPAAGAPGPS